MRITFVSRKKNSLRAKIHLCRSFPRSTPSTYEVMYVFAHLDFKFVFPGGTCNLPFLGLWFINDQNHFLFFSLSFDAHVAQKVRLVFRYSLLCIFPRESSCKMENVSYWRTPWTIF